MQYPIKLTKDDNNTLLVTFPDFKDAVTFGDDKKDAIFHACNALDEVIAARMAHRENIPKPSLRVKSDAKVPLSPLTETKLLLYWEMQKRKLKKADLAKLLACNQKQIDRLLDVRHNSTINQMERAFAALGKRITVQIREDVIITN